MTRSQLKQVPQVAVEVFKHSNSAVILFFRIADEPNAFVLHVLIVAPEIIGVQKQKHPSTALVSNEGALFGFGSLGQQQVGSNRSWGRHHNPALVLGRLIGIFHKFKAQLLCVEFNCLVIVIDNNSDMNDRLFHVLAANSSKIAKRLKRNFIIDFAARWSAT